DFQGLAIDFINAVLLFALVLAAAVGHVDGLGVFGGIQLEGGIVVDTVVHPAEHALAVKNSHGPVFFQGFPEYGMAIARHGTQFPGALELVTLLGGSFGRVVGSHHQPGGQQNKGICLHGMSPLQGSICPQKETRQKMCQNAAGGLARFTKPPAAKECFYFSLLASFVLTVKGRYSTCTSFTNSAKLILPAPTCSSAFFEAEMISLAGR